MSVARPIVRTFEFGASSRPSLQFSDPTKINLDAANCVVSLKRNTGGYSTSENVYFRSPAWSPQEVRKWRAISVERKTPRNVAGIQSTSVGLRIYDGTTDYWWNGSAWTANPSAGQWSTIAQVQAHIGTFPVASRSIRIVCNLRTTDSTVTPTVSRISILADVAVSSFGEDLLYSTVIPSIRSGAKFLVDLNIVWAGGTTMTLALDETDPVEFDEIDGAYDRSLDPNKRSNLLSSYNSGTKLLTLTGSKSSGTVIRLQVLAKPSVAVTTNTDYDEIASTPALFISSFAETFVAESQAETVFVDESSPTALATRVPAPRQVTIAMAVEVIASRARDRVRMSEALEAWVRKTRALTIASTDTVVRLSVASGLESQPTTTVNNVQGGKLGIELHGLEKWMFDTSAGHGVKSFNVGGSFDVVIP